MEQFSKKTGISVFLMIVLIVLAIVLAGGGAWYYMDGKASDEKAALQAQIDSLSAEVEELQLSADKSDVAEEADSEPVATADSTADWKTYTNTLTGFSIKYPSDWKVVNSTNGPIIANLQSPANAAASTCRSAGCDHPSSANIQEYSIAMGVKEYLDNQAALPDPVFTDVASAKIGGVNGYSANKGPNQFGGGQSYLVQSKKDNNNVIEFWFFDNDSDYSKDMTAKILSTFKFIQ